MEDTACAVCDGREARPERRHGPWTLVRCRVCGLVYLNPRPSPGDIEKDYDWFRHGEPQARERRARETLLRRLLRKARGRGLLRRKPRTRVVLDRIRRFATGGRFLDVGCGVGDMVATMQQAGFEAHGLDISEVAVETCRRRGRANVLRSTVHDAPFPDASFDAVLLMSCLEHEPWPARALRRVHDLLKPSGHVLVKVPHYGSWNRVFMGRSWSGYYFPQHLWYFTPRTLAALFSRCGLETVRNGFLDHLPVSDVFWATARRPGGG